MDNYLDAEEREVVESYERDEWQPVPNMEQEMARYQALAAAQLERMIGVNVFLPIEDLEVIQSRAAEAGVTYQTLIAEVMHQFVQGKLISR